MGNLTGQQIVLIIIVIIILLWLINWWLTSNNRARNIAAAQNYWRDRQLEQIPQLNQNPQQYARQVEHMHQQSVAQPIDQAVEQPVAPSDIDAQQDAPFILYYFYSPNCSACKQFADAWNEVSSKLNNINGISVRAINGDKPENENLVFYYNIGAYPTVILVTPHKDVEYTGNRSPSDLYNFVLSNVNDYANTQNPQAPTC